MIGKFCFIFIRRCSRLLNEGCWLKLKDVAKQSYSFLGTGANILVGTMMLEIVFVFAQGFGR